MPDEFTLKVSSLGGVLVVVSLFVTGRQYFRSDPMVRPSPSYSPHPEQLELNVSCSQLDAIPTVGFSDPILSYFSTLRFFFDCVRILKEGYEKTRPGLFKMAFFRRWMVLVAGSELIEDVRKAPEDVLSMIELTKELVQPEYTIDLLNQNDMFHTDVVRSKLTRNIAGTFKEVREELIMAMDDFIPMRGDEWVKVPILETIQRVICRTTNRIFVGVPLWTMTIRLEFNLRGQSLEIRHDHQLISEASQAARGLLSPCFLIQQQIEFIRPMVEERFAKMEDMGMTGMISRFNDMLMWLMSEAKGVERSVEGVARRLLLVNFAAVHSTSLASDDISSISSLTLTQALYRLLANPEYIEPLREEVDAVIKEEGWTKAGIDKMHKIDSFLRESLRLDSFLLFAVTRLALRQFTFSNGVTVPAGTLVSVPASAIHTDERIYPNANEFDGFRFANLCESEGDTMTSRYQSVSPSSEHLVFGLGRHVCPGRFLAVNEIKALFAHIIATYEIKFEEGKGVPREVCIRGMRIPGKANVMFRTRQK
ncbi:cytochrome P450 [Russula vinacea]|nr:cytochrome P450 [Russula vinacea]